MQRWIILGGGAIVATAALISVPPHRAKVVDLPVASINIIDAGDIGDLPPGTEFKLSREAEAKLSASKLIDSAKLRKDARLGGGLDLIAAYDGVAQLYSTKPYASILPPGLGVALDGPPEEARFVPTRVFEKDEAYGPFERQGRDDVVVQYDENYGGLFGSINIGVVIDR